MHWADLVGYLASGLVVLTFYMDDMISLRVAAIFSNIAFLAYGLSLGLGPVILLHGILLPLNVWRLRQVLKSVGTPRNARLLRVWRAAPRRSLNR